MQNSGKALKKVYKCEFSTVQSIYQKASIQKLLIELHTICPRCGKGKMEYNGLLNLECPVCHFEYGGGYT